jgi:hypothetical protein
MHKHLQNGSPKPNLTSISTPHANSVAFPKPFIWPLRLLLPRLQLQLLQWLQLRLLRPKQWLLLHLLLLWIQVLGQEIQRGLVEGWG